MSEFLHGSTMASYDVGHRRHLQVVSSAPEPAWVSRLSSREIEVLQCIAAGLSTNEIAQTLFISTATVKSHVARLIAKVGVRDRLQLVVTAYQSGFVSTD